MKVGYIIATYSGTSRDHDSICEDNALELHLTELYKTICLKLKKNSKCLLHDIIVMCPKFRGNYIKDYYQFEKWFKFFNSTPVNIHFIQCKGDNKHHSYDQWIQGCKLFDNDYYILMEDDYLIPSHHYNFDHDLVDLYQKTCPNNVGYLCQTIESTRNFLGTHATLTNGVVSSDTMNQLTLEQFYKTKHWVPQVQFYWFFIQNKVDVVDMTCKYNAYFWNSITSSVQVIFQSEETSDLILPLQALHLN